MKLYFVSRFYTSLVNEFELQPNLQVANGYISRDSMITTCRETFVFLGLVNPEGKAGQFMSINIGGVKVLYCPALDTNESIYLSSFAQFHNNTVFSSVYEKNCLTVDPNMGRQHSKTKKLPGQARYLLYGEISQKEDFQPFFVDDGWKFHESIYKNELLHMSLPIVRTFVGYIAKSLTSSAPDKFPKIRRIKFGSIDTIGKGNHQITHCDHEHVLDRPEGHHPCYVGHIPLSEEGLFLRIEEPSAVALTLLQSNVEKVSIPESENCKFNAVKNVFYVHVPFNGALFIDEKTWHGGHYGSIGQKRCHMVVCPEAESWSFDDETDTVLMFDKVLSNNAEVYNGKTGMSVKPFYPKYNVKLDTLKGMCDRISAHQCKIHQNAVGIKMNRNGWDPNHLLLATFSKIFQELLSSNNPLSDMEKSLWKKDDSQKKKSV